MSNLDDSSFNLDDSSFNWSESFELSSVSFLTIDTTRSSNSYELTEQERKEVEESLALNINTLELKNQYDEMGRQMALSVKQELAEENYELKVLYIICFLCV